MENWAAGNNLLHLVKYMRAASYSPVQSKIISLERQPRSRAQVGSVSTFPPPDSCIPYIDPPSVNHRSVNLYKH